jgi:hypothetical protein
MREHLVWESSGTLTGLIRADHRRGQDRGTDVRHQPEDSDLSGPAVPEKTYRQQDGTRDHDRHSELRYPDPAIAVLETLVHPVIEARGDLRAHAVAYGESDEVQAGDLRGEIVAIAGLCPERRKRGDDQIYEAAGRTMSAIALSSSSARCLWMRAY